LRKKIRNYIFTLAYRDPIRAETISTIEVAYPVKVWRKDGSFSWKIDFVDKGEDLMDSRGSRGQGSFQQ